MTEQATLQTKEQKLLLQADELLHLLMKQVNWGASAISGETIGLLNATLCALKTWRNENGFYLEDSK